MKKVKYKLKSYVKNTLFVVVLLSFSLIAIHFSVKAYNSKIIEKITYNDNSKVNYKVYLKENNFFETPYLDKNSTYISSLIKYIDVSFNYKMNYTKPVSGKYSYYVQAKIMANKSNSDDKNYWSKVYQITPSADFNVNNQLYFEINTDVKIDYQQYNELLAQFKREYGLPIDGILKVELIVDSEVNNGKLAKNIINNSNTNIEMPLTQSSVDIEIKPSSISNVMKEIEENNNVLYNKYRSISFFILTVMLIICSIFINNIIKERKKRDKYTVELKKILATYDGIIVNVDHLQNLNEYEIINVKSFNELIDAHSEVRMPINYVELEEHKESVFVLINDNIAWMYRLISK